MIIRGDNMTARTNVRNGRMAEVTARLSNVYLNGTGEIGAQLREMIRKGKGGVFVDKDGVLTRIDRQIEEGLRREFVRHRDPRKGIVYDFDRELVYKLFGISPRYNDGATPILALMALNLEAGKTDGATANDLLRKALKSDNAVAKLDALIAKHTAKYEDFVMKNMYWWREPDGFFWTEEAHSYIDAHRGPNEVTSWEALMALRDAGIPVGIITNAPNHDLHTAGVSRRELETVISDQGYHVPGTVMVLTREHAERRGHDKKPHPGLLYHAGSEMRVNVGNSIFVGDTISDMDFATNAGATPVGVESGMGSSLHLRQGKPGLIVVEDLPTLAAALLREA